MKKLLSMFFILCLLLAAVPGLSEAAEAPSLPGLTWVETLPLTFATEFRVDYYEGGYKLLTIGDGNRYLVVPEDGRAPERLDGDIRVLQQPLDRIYMAATSVMSLFDAVDGLDAIALSGTKADGWAIESAVKAMEEGRIAYAGKYSEPDYELLLGSGCDLAIESTMILHTPQVRDMIEQLGIPVFIDRSSYEDHPLGRTEWVKLYGALLNREDQAAAFFENQAKVIEDLKDFPNTEKTVAFFYLSSDGSAVVRSTSDYVPVMIELAGGRYVFRDALESTDARSSVSLTMEEFYAAAVDADYLIYNSNIDAGVSSIADLMGKSPLFADFRAVKSGDVWLTDSALYQATGTVGQFILDIHRMLTGDAGEMTFLRKLG